MKTHNMADETSVVVSNFVISTKMENAENPFTADGILSQKADYIISHSTITRTEIQIADPDLMPNKGGKPESYPVEENTHTKETSNMLETKPSHSMPKTEEKLNEIVEPQSIEVEVSKGTASLAAPQRAEEVKLKKSKKCGKCCTIA